MRYSIAIVAFFVAIHEASPAAPAAPCTSTSTSTAVETIMITVPPTMHIPSLASTKSTTPKALSSLAQPTLPISNSTAALHPQPPTKDFVSSFFLEHQLKEMAASDTPFMIPTVTVTTTVSRCPKSTPMPYTQMTNQNSLVAPLSSAPATHQQMSIVGPTSNSPRPSRPLQTSTRMPTAVPTSITNAKYITTSILRFIPRTSLVTSHIMPTPQCVLVTPSAESISVQTVSQLSSRWITTVVPEGQERLWQQFGGSGNNNFGGSNENSVHLSSSAWFRHFVVRAGQTFEVTENSVPTMF